MSNELQAASSLLPITDKPVDKVDQTGENNFFIENHADIHFHVDTPKIITYDLTGNDWMAIQKFSRQYYQLLVTCENIMEQTFVSPLANRSLVKATVPDEIFDSCSTLSPTGQDILKTIPAIICHENTEYNAVTDPKQMAIYGRILKINRLGRENRVHFKIIRMFPQQLLCEHCLDFDLNMDCYITDLNSSAWTVHKVDLFSAFESAGLKDMPKPN